MFRRRAVLAVLALVSVACLAQDGFDRAFRSSNFEEVSDLRTLMGRHSIRYRNAEQERSRDGFFYRSADERRMLALREKLDRQTLVKYKEPEARDYMQMLLAEMNLEFIVTERADGLWIKWFPESKQQSDEVEMR